MQGFNSPYVLGWIISLTMIGYTFWWGFTNLTAIQKRCGGAENRSRSQILAHTFTAGGMIAIFTALGGLFAGVATGTFAVRFDWAFHLAVAVQVTLYFLIRHRLGEWLTHEQNMNKP